MDDLTILICTHGDPSWRQLALERALPSAETQGLTKAWHHPSPEATVAQVRNWAAGETDTDWICFLDADDELDFGFVDAMDRAAGQDALLAPAVKYVDPRRKTAPPMLPNRTRPMTVLNHCAIGTLMPRKAFLEAGGFRELPIYEDWDLFLTLHLGGLPIVDVPDAVYKAYVTPGGRNIPDRVTASTYRQILADHGLASR